MCLTVKELKFKTAEEDIVVYKHALYDGEYKSPYRECLFEVDKLLVATDRFGNPVNIAAHHRTSPYYESRFYIDFGFHSFTRLNDARRDSISLFTEFGYYRCLFMCIIPKGSIYIEGIYGNASTKSIVSNQIIYKKQI